MRAFSYRLFLLAYSVHRFAKYFCDRQSFAPSQADSPKGHTSELLSSGTKQYFLSVLMVHVKEGVNVCLRKILLNIESSEVQFL